MPAQRKRDPENTVSFDVSEVERATIAKIVDRAMELKAFQQLHVDRFELGMDLTAVHANGCALELALLLAYPNFDFVHDVAGIRRHLDRNTGKLRDFFVPRCARPDVAR